MDPIVKEMLDTTFGLDLDIEEEIHKLPPCEITGHAINEGGYCQPEEPAEYMVISPCGAAKFACARWVESGKLTSHTNCKFCGTEHSNADYSYIPLNIRN